MSRMGKKENPYILLCILPRASAAMGKDEVKVRVALNGGKHRATAWGCDLTAEYVAINSDYTT